ncbi:MAG TPA: hypothetical protein VKN99_03750 [Polyangia bacterium]|nr:hypothetical protein [Polyangia bacterium]
MEARIATSAADATVVADGAIRAGCGNSAHAVGVRKQIYQEAQQDSALAGLKKPSLRTAPLGRTKVRATLLSLGRTMPGTNEQRLPQKGATFKLFQTSEGQIATPVKVRGKVWQQLYVRGRVRQSSRRMGQPARWLVIALHWHVSTWRPLDLPERWA